MANWQNVEASAALVEMIQKAAREAFEEVTGQAMPESFGNWSFRKMRGEYIFGIEMEAAEKALKPKAGGNVAKHDGETRAAIVAWVEYLGAGNGKLQDVPESIRAAVSRAMQPATESLMPPTRKAESLMPPAKGGAAPKLPAKGVGVISNAAAINAARRLTRKAG